MNGKFEMIIHGENSQADTKIQFGNMSSMIGHARKMLNGSPDQPLAGLFAPGYTVGQLHHSRSGEYTLEWRLQQALDTPECHCAECGGDLNHDGKCRVCGESTMIVCSEVEYVSHREISIF